MGELSGDEATAGEVCCWLAGGGAVTFRDDDIAPGEEGGSEVSEVGSDDDWRVGHDLQGAAAVFEQQGGEVSLAGAGAVSDGCVGVWGGAGEWAAGDLDGALVDAGGDRWGEGAGGPGVGGAGFAEPVGGAEAVLCGSG